MDASLYRDINRLAVHSGWAHEAMKLDAVYGVGLFGLGVLAAWWLARLAPDAPRAVAAAIWAAVGTVAAVGVNQPIVSGVHRARPFLSIRTAEVLVTRGHDFSFPSDHATAAGAAAAGLWIVTHYARNVRALAVMASVWAVLLAFARVYVGVHYPGDVLAGLAVGATVAVVGWAVLNRPLVWLTTLVSRRRPVAALVAGRLPEPEGRPSA